MFAGIRIHSCQGSGPTLKGGEGWGRAFALVQPSAHLDVVLYISHCPYLHRTAVASVNPEYPHCNRKANPILEI